MEVGIGLDPTLQLSYAEQAQLSAEAARLGYQQVWTPESSSEDAFQLCQLRWAATRDAVPGGVVTGIGVSPVALRTPIGFAMSAATMSKQTDGRFILGIGSGQVDVPGYRRTWDVRGDSALGLMRDYLITIRGLVNGETVSYEGSSITLRGAKLNVDPPQRTPVYLGALGPKMLALGGELADGICLNWSSAETVASSREVVAEAAKAAGRDPSEVTMMEYIRVCVDEDEALARRAFTRSLMFYALGQLDAPPRSYRAHFERMGFTDDLRRIDDMRRAKAPQDEIVDAFPEAMLRKVGYYGKAAGAAAAFKSVSAGLDVAIVRVVGAKPGMESARAAVQACKAAIGA
jgi:alkanesulfonate monooxygenase SsuD/methylene tetrahydromethanopterin reductase-like flavin-dependent oxidoreductase (luciferase family)